METKKCSTLKDSPKDFNWDLSNVTELKSLESMNENQAKYCFENKLLYNYPLIGMSAFIDGNIKEFFNAL